MKVAVIGAGALGTLFGGLLSAAGEEIWLLHHDEGYASELDDRGVRIEGEGTSLRADVRATADASRVGPADLAIVLVRSYQTVDALEGHAACLGPETRVLSLQNGLTNHHRLREHVGAERALNGVTYQAATVEGPGHVVRTGSGPTVFGGEDAAFAERVGETFEAAGIEARVVEDPWPDIWEKQLWGVAIKPVAALTRLPNAALVADPAIAAVMDGLMEEAGEVAAARGVRVDAEDVREELRETLAGTEHRSSMLQDVAAGRRTEIDDVNGAIVELAREEGLSVPYNEMATALVGGLERSYLSEG